MSRLKIGILRAGVIAGLALSANQAYALCTFGGSGEPSLQGSFNTLLGPGAPNAVTACVAEGDDAAWTTFGSVASVDIVLELAGNAQSNTLGVYDLNDPTRRLTVFEGNDGVNSQATLRLRQTATGWVVRVQEINNPGDPSGWTSMSISTSAFGFYLGTASNGTFFSNTALNTDGVDHLYSYAGTGGLFVSGPLDGEVFALHDYILAWEDLFGGGDGDYQDFVAIVQDITPVPLPTAIWLLASGLIGLAGVARRRG